MNVGGVELDLFAVAALLAALGTLYGQVRTHRGLQDKAQTIDAIEHEVKANSGASMRDAVDRIEAKVGTLADRITVLEQRSVRSLWRR